MTLGSSLGETLPYLVSSWPYLIDISVVFWDHTDFIALFPNGLGTLEFLVVLEEKETFIRGLLVVSATDAEKNAWPSFFHV